MLWDIHGWWIKIRLQTVNGSAEESERNGSHNSQKLSFNSIAVAFVVERPSIYQFTPHLCDPHHRPWETVQSPWKVRAISWRVTCWVLSQMDDGRAAAGTTTWEQQLLIKRDVADAFASQADLKEEEDLTRTISCPWWNSSSSWNVYNDSTKDGWHRLKNLENFSRKCQRFLGSMNLFSSNIRRPPNWAIKSQVDGVKNGQFIIPLFLCGSQVQLLQSLTRSLAIVIC